MLNKLFSQMFRPTDVFENDRQMVDLKPIQYLFRGSFNAFIYQDAYKFLVHVMNGVTNETVSP